MTRQAYREESLTVNRFMGIESLSLDIRRFNLIIGPQASGKSLVAKLIYFMSRAECEITQGALKAQLKKDIDSELSHLFNQIFPVSAWGSGNFKIRYVRGDFSLEISKKASKDEIKLSYGDAAQKLLAVVRGKAKRVERDYLEQDRFVSNIYDKSLRDFSKEKQAEIYGLPPLSNPIFIPAGRSFYSAIKEGFWNLITKSMTVDPIYSDFGSIYESMKDFWMTAPGSKAQRGAKSFDASIEALLRGKPLREKGQDFILSSDRRKVRMLNASSGQQELYPLLVVLKTLAYAVSYPTFLMIEEPEAHLFPKAQSDLMWLISKALNEMPSHSKVLITTHSPYVLATLNNQILAAHLDENRAKKSLRSYYEASLPADVVGASFIESGRISTIDREDYGLLDAGVIDSVSSEIADQTEMLMGEVLLG